MEVVSHVCIEVKREKYKEGKRRRGGGKMSVKMQNACLQIIRRCVAVLLTGVVHS